MGCKKAEGFLAAHDLAVRQHEDARKTPRGRAEALKLARSAGRVIIGKGKNVITFDMRTQPPDDETLLAHLLRPTGNLRAPTIKKGDTLLVGFSEHAYRRLLDD